jgi:hypothetical protein
MRKEPANNLMRVLFDENVPYNLRRVLSSHTVQFSAELGWGGLENGDLLSAAEAASMDVMVKADQNIRYQQNLLDRKIALVVLGSNRWPYLRSICGDCRCCERCERRSLRLHRRSAAAEA